MKGGKPLSISEGANLSKFLQFGSESRDPIILALFLLFLIKFEIKLYCFDIDWF